ncbi:MAG: DNA mismatch repair protein MutS, partial [Alphaproteobacteria bacterium]|nr:DNA mismatch repair protein MutS [Alphaproteobacteria bacterium]
MGSFIPAESAHIGCVDKLFSRVGASDDLARGQSTFMVEMVETAAILNQATEHSLVILDEIGRGTATYDGLSLAWASLEHLHEKNKCRTLFATHYHEMTELETKLSRLSCHTMRIREWENSIIFLHEVIKGVADRSYGIHVAQLAGLPNDVIKRASKILERLESQDKGSTRKQVSEELPLFSPFVHQDLQEENVSPIVREVEELDPNSMTPKEALDTLFRLKELLES